jgi:hypothetical protein
VIEIYSIRGIGVPIAAGEEVRGKSWISCLICDSASAKISSKWLCGSIHSGIPSGRTAMTDYELAKRVAEEMAHGMALESRPQKHVLQSPTAAKRKSSSNDAFLLSLAKSPRYLAMKWDAIVAAGARSEQQIADYYREKSESDPQLHLVESLHHMRLDAQANIAHEVDLECQSDRALSVAISAYQDAARIALLLGEEEPIYPHRGSYTASNHAIWDEFVRYVERTIAQHLQVTKSKYQVLFPPKLPENLETDPKEWTFRELVAVCSTNSRPNSLSDPREAYLLFVSRLADQVSLECTLSYYGNLLSRKFRRHFVQPAYLLLEEEIGWEHGRIRLPMAELQSSIAPIRKAVRTMQEFAFWPRLNPGDDEIAEKVKSLDPAKLTQEQRECVRRVKMEESDVFKLHDFKLEVLEPALAEFGAYHGHCLGASGVKKQMTQKPRKKKKPKIDAHTEPLSWDEMSEPMQRILTQLSKSKGGVLGLKLSGLVDLSHGAIRKATPHLRRWKYIGHSSRGFEITALGIDMLSCDPV